MWDLLIVGTGPAGVSAALTARARGLSFLWFGSRRLSDKVEKAERILNYPGLPRVTGRELRDAFLRQVDDLGIPIQQARVAAVYEMGGHYAVCAGPDFYEGRCLILATGVAARGQIPGESRLLGKGVSCCATCDGELYRGRNIAVVCESQSLEEDVRFLQSVAGHVELFCTYAGGLADTPGCHKGRPQSHRGGRPGDRGALGGCDPPGGGRVLPAGNGGPAGAPIRPCHGKRPYPGGPRPAHQPARLLCRRGLHRPPLPVRQGGGRGQCGGAQRAGFPGTAAGGTAMKPGWLGYLGRLAGVLAGNALLAYGVAAVYLPAGLAVGGATGVGLILHTLFGLDTAVSVFVLNLGLLVAGWICIGREFAINTAAGSLAYPVFLGLCQRLPAFSLLETDRFAALVCGACVVGAGVGVTLRAGASTGGSDLLAMILHRTIRLPVAGVKMAADYGVMAMAFWMAGGRNLWFSVMALAIETFVMNRTMVAGAAQLQLLVISDHYEEIRQALLCEAQAGVTMLHADTGLRRTAGSVVFCVIPNKKLYGVKAAIHRIDPGAFLTIATVREVQGQGFTAARIPLPVGK